ncbi:MAG: STAS domain-containing protein [Fimbriimonas sp.]
MRIETSTNEGVMVARLESESLETGNVAAFRNAITPVVEKNEQVVLDLSRVAFMDSTGLGAMLSCLRSLKAKNGSLKLASLTPEVEQLFEMVLMDRVFDIYPDATAAAGSFGSSRAR